MLRYLTEHPKEAVSHRELLQAAWGPDYGDQVDYLRVVIKNLRKKLSSTQRHPSTSKLSPGSGTSSIQFRNLHKLPLRVFFRIPI